MLPNNVPSTWEPLARPSAREPRLVAPSTWKQGTLGPAIGPTSGPLALCLSGPQVLSQYRLSGCSQHPPAAREAGHSRLPHAGLAALQTKCHLHRHRGAQPAQEAHEREHQGRFARGMPQVGTGQVGGTALALLGGQLRGEPSGLRSSTCSC